MRLFLAILGLLLFVGNYQICELVYFDNIDKWWGLKQNIYNVIIAIFAYLAYDNKNKYYVFVMYIVVGFCISNCVDRLFYNINTFRIEDIVMGLITIGIAIYKYVRQGR